LLEKHKQEQNSKYKLAPAKNLAGTLPDLGEVRDVGKRPGRAADLALLLDEKATRYLMIAVATEPDGCYVVVGDCSWQSRQIWQQEFRDLLEKFRFTKKGE